MLGNRIRITYRDESAPDEVTVTHYALGRIARWARANDMVGLAPDGQNMAETVLFIQLACWAEKTRGSIHPPDFDEWVARVADFDPIEGEESLDPTQPAT